MSFLENDCSFCGREAYDLAADLAATFPGESCPLCGRAGVDREPEEPIRRAVRASADYPDWPGKRGARRGDPSPPTEPPEEGR